MKRTICRICLETSESFIVAAAADLTGPSGCGLLVPATGNHRAEDTTGRRESTGVVEMGGVVGASLGWAT
jgi:hypothetical protein